MPFFLGRETVSLQRLFVLSEVTKRVERLINIRNRYAITPEHRAFIEPHQPCVETRVLLVINNV